jgi:hypothetical protein
MIIQEELQSGRILALSWKEPYASMMLHGKIETRVWKTNYRGLVLICAGKVPYQPEQIRHISGTFRMINILSLFNETSFFLSRSKYKSGYAIAIGRLIDCRPMTKEDENGCFVKYRPELWCHVYQDVSVIEPIPFKGGQKWRKVSQDIINQIKIIS